jgi:hypothetical protein
VLRADNLTIFMPRLSKNLGASTSWNPKDLSRSVMGLLFLIKPLRPAVTVYYTKVDVQNSTFIHTVHFFFKVDLIKLLYLYTALTDWFFLTETECVYCAVRTESLKPSGYYMYHDV